MKEKNTLCFSLSSALDNEWRKKGEKQVFQKVLKTLPLRAPKNFPGPSTFWRNTLRVPKTLPACLEGGKPKKPSRGNKQEMESGSVCFLPATLTKERDGEKIKLAPRTARRTAASTSVGGRRAEEKNINLERCCRPICCSVFRSRPRHFAIVSTRFLIEASLTR